MTLPSSADSFLSRSPSVLSHRATRKTSWNRVDERVFRETKEYQRPGAIGSGTTRRWTRARPSLPSGRVDRAGNGVGGRSAWRARTLPRRLDAALPPDGVRAPRKPFQSPDFADCIPHPDGLPGDGPLLRIRWLRVRPVGQTNLNAGPGGMSNHGVRRGARPDFENLRNAVLSLGCLFPLLGYRRSWGWLLGITPILSNSAASCCESLQTSTTSAEDRSGHSTGNAANPTAIARAPARRVMARTGC